MHCVLIWGSPLSEVPLHIVPVDIVPVDIVPVGFPLLETISLRMVSLKG